MLHSLKPSLVLMGIIIDTQLELLLFGLSVKSSLFNPNFCFYTKPSLQDITSPGLSLKLNVPASTSAKKRQKKKKKKVELRQYFWKLSCTLCWWLLVIPISRFAPTTSCYFSCQTRNWHYRQCKPKANVCGVLREGVLFEFYLTSWNETQNLTV